MAKQVTNLERVDMAAATVDMLDLSAIFTMFTSTFLHTLLEHGAKYIVFPIAAAINLFRAGLAFREAQLKKWEANPLAKFIIEAVGALAIVTAVVGSFVLPVIFTLVAPIIFSSVLAAKAIFNFGLSIFHGVQAATETNSQKKTEHIRKTAEHASVGTALSLACAGVVTVMIFGKVALAGIAIAGGLLGAATAVFKFYKTFSKKPEVETPEAEETSSSTLGFKKFFNREKKPDIQIVTKPENPYKGATTIINVPAAKKNQPVNLTLNFIDDYAEPPQESPSVARRGL